MHNPVTLFLSDHDSKINWHHHQSPCTCSNGTESCSNGQACYVSLDLLVLIVVWLDLIMFVCVVVLPGLLHRMRCL